MSSEVSELWIGQDYWKGDCCKKVYNPLWFKVRVSTAHRYLSLQPRICKCKLWPLKRGCDSHPPNLAWISFLTTQSKAQQFCYSVIQLLLTDSIVSVSATVDIISRVGVKTKQKKVLQHHFLCLSIKCSLWILELADYRVSYPFGQFCPLGGAQVWNLSPFFSGMQFCNSNLFIKVFL